MKTSSFAVKLITVSFFITFIICFIWYRVDAVGKSSAQEYSELNESYFNSNTLTVADTPVVKKDSLYKQIMSSSKSTTIMSSSKSIIMSSSKSISLPNPRRFGFDTLKVKKDNYEQTEQMKKTTIMSSSKSAIIFEPKPSPDTTKKKNLKKSNYMGSSKSAVIFEPEPTPDTAKKSKK